MIWNGSDGLNYTESGQDTVEDTDIIVTLKTALTKKPFQKITNPTTLKTFQKEH